MKNTNNRRHEFDTTGMDALKPATALGLKPPEPDMLMRGKQEGTSDSYHRHDPVEFCAWGYPLELGNY